MAQARRWLADGLVRQATARDEMERKTPEAARTAGPEIKGRFPTLQVSIYPRPGFSLPLSDPT
jgi:hypothetical protein